MKTKNFVLEITEKLLLWLSVFLRTRDCRKMCTGRIRYQKLLFLRVIKSFPFCVFQYFPVIISCSTCCHYGPVRGTWVCASFNSDQVIISSSTCCLYGPVRATWVCASFNSNQVIRSELKLAQTHVALTGPTRQQVLQLMMTWLELKLAQTHIALTGLTREQVLQLMMTSIFSTSTFSPAFSCSSLYVLELESECFLRFFILLILSNFWFWL